ncbi:hypothetical protein [Helicobacter pylori]|uniref:hypothetical protein n=1 Tax=Helicobacter pylori TaxID=210 RepID=UPI0013CDDF9C|nr:hypothetical protein [Helicobacter pylori]
MAKYTHKEFREMLAKRHKNIPKNIKLNFTPLIKALRSIGMACLKVLLLIFKLWG